MSKKNHPAPPPPPPQRPDEKPPKKRGGGCLLLIIILLILIIIALMLLNYFGIFGGKSGTDSGDGDGPSASQSSVIDKEVEESSQEQQYADITVSGDNYIFDNSNSQLTDIVKAVKDMDSSVLVRITDQNASFNAMDDLKKALDEAGISYSEVSGS